jgi:hypothetical protein
MATNIPNHKHTLASRKQSTSPKRKRSVSPRRKVHTRERLRKAVFEQRVKSVFDTHIVEIVGDWVKVLHDIQLENDRRLHTVKESLDREMNDLTDHLLSEVHRVGMEGINNRRDLMGIIEERFASLDERLSIFSRTGLANAEQIDQLVRSQSEQIRNLDMVKEKLIISDSQIKAHLNSDRDDLGQTTQMNTQISVSPLVDSRRPLPDSRRSLLDSRRSLLDSRRSLSDSRRTHPESDISPNQSIPECARNNGNNKNPHMSPPNNSNPDPQSNQAPPLVLTPTTNVPHNSTFNIPQSNNSGPNQFPIIFQSGGNVPAPTFNPKLETAGNFIRELELYLRRKRIPYEDWTLMLSPIFNKDLEQALWWKRAKMVAHDWESFKKHFLGFYGSESEKNSTLEKLLLRRQSEQESFQKFAFEMDLMYRKVYNMDTENNTPEILSFISERALPTLKPHLLAYHAKDLYELVLYGSKIETPYKKAPEPKRLNEAHSNPKWNNKPYNKVVSGDTEKPPQLSKVSQVSNAKSSDTVPQKVTEFCKKCRKVGHWTPDCPKKSAQGKKATVRPLNDELVLEPVVSPKSQGNGEEE